MHCFGHGLFLPECQGMQSRSGKQRTVRDTTIAGNDYISRAGLVMHVLKPHMLYWLFITGTPNWALTVKTTVPTPCTPPFRKFSAVECL